MSVSGVLGDHNWTGRGVVAGLLFLAGAGLAGVGSYFHLTTAAQVRAGGCDGCDPWHPLVVVTPLVVGSLLVCLGGYLSYQAVASSPRR